MPLHTHAHTHINGDIITLVVVIFLFLSASIYHYCWMVWLSFIISLLHWRVIAAIGLLRHTTHLLTSVIAAAITIIFIITLIHAIYTATLCATCRETLLRHTNIRRCHAGTLLLLAAIFHCYYAAIVITLHIVIVGLLHAITEHIHIITLHTSLFAS